MFFLALTFLTFLTYTLTGLTESWKDKKRFPPALIDPMIHAIGVAIETESFNEKFFDALPFVINYNRFTMKVSLGYFFANHSFLMLVG